MRDRLIELLQSVPADDEGELNVGVIADYLLANGVYVVPHKVGDPIWTSEPFADGEMRQGYIEAVTFGGREEGVWSYWASFAGLPVSYEFITDDIGKSVFLTREEAEAALKERDDNG